MIRFGGIEMGMENRVYVVVELSDVPSRLEIVDVPSSFSLSSIDWR